jgi:malate permease and related proteins
MYDIGNTFCGFGLVYPIGQYFAKNTGNSISWQAILKKVFTLPPLLGMIFGLTISILHIPLPDTIFDFMSFLARGNAPIGLMLLGIYLSFNLERKQIFGISKVLLIRYFFGLLVLIAIYLLIPEGTLRNVLMLISILPLGMMILPFSDEMGFDTRIAATLSNASLLISFVLMWVLINILKL